MTDDSDRYRLTVSLDAVRDFPIHDALNQVLPDRRASLLRTLAILGAYQWRLIQLDAKGANLAPTSPGADGTVMALKGAIE